MAFDKDAAANADLPVVRDAWVKPEILSFEPVSAAQAAIPGSVNDAGLGNQS